MPRRQQRLRADLAPLTPLAEASGGGARFLAADGMPDIRRIRPDRAAAGSSWIGLRRNGAYEVTAITQVPLLPAALALILAVGLLMTAWWREGR